MAVSVATRGRRRGARAVLAGLVGCLLASGVAGAPAPAGAAPVDRAGGAANAAAPDSPRALVAFLPAAPRSSERTLAELAERGLAVGLMSPTVGGYSPEQSLLDMSQGARLTGAAYDGVLDRLDLRTAGGGGRIDGWRAVRSRAEAAAGTVAPGLLASTVEGAGKETAYAGVSERRAAPLKAVEHGQPVRRPVTPTEPEEEAIVAANRAGRIQHVSLGSGRTLAGRALELWRASELVVARLPGGEAGLEATDRLLAAAGPADLVAVIHAPPPTMELLATGLRADGVAGTLTSETTRRDGLVAAPDVAPTVLAHLGVDEPPAMQGQVLEGAAGTVADVRDLEGRLAVIAPRRDTALFALLAGWALVFATLAVARRRAGARTALRIGFLAALWLPALALLTAALRPSEAVEVAVLAGGSLVLGAATDRLLPWPSAPVVPAAAVLASHAVDLVAGSPLIAASLAGPNPLGGARFYGVGNELEVILSLAVLLGTGAALTLTRGTPDAVLPRAFAAASLVAAVVLGAGQLGAAVGGVITLAAGGAAAVLASLAARPSRRALALAVAAPALALACLAAIDIATAGGAHFSREVLQGGGPGDLLETVERRLDLSLSGLERPGRAIAVAVAAALLVVGVARRRRLLAPLDRAGPVAARAFRAGLLGALVATVVGALANDSGPTIFLIGSVMLGLAIVYVRGRPPEDRLASTTISRCA